MTSTIPATASNPNFDQTATISATLLATGMIQLAGPVGLTLRFVPPIKAESAAAKFSLSTPPAHYTYDAGEPPATYDRRADVNLRYFDAAYQELGLNSLPTRFAFPRLGNGRGRVFRFHLAGREATG